MADEEDIQQQSADELETGPAAINTSESLENQNDVDSSDLENAAEEARQASVSNGSSKGECPPCKSGSPAWMATFADMATLLMAFFVLLLSFAETEVPKFKQISGSLKAAFGI